MDVKIDTSSGVKVKNRQDYGFNWLYLKRFWFIHKVLFPSVKTNSFALLCVLIIISSLEQYLAFRVGLISGTFYEVLGEKDVDRFQTHLINSLIIIGLMACTVTTRVYITDTMVVIWRERLTQHLHQAYFSGIKFYQLNLFYKCDVDNPDQRLTADVDILCTNYGSIINGLLVPPFAIAYYAYSAFTRAGWLGPTSMFGFFIVSSILNKLLMSPIARMIFKRERLEGDFRFRHAIIRAQSESLAFLGSEAILKEYIDAKSKLEKLCYTQQRVYIRQSLLNLATNTFDYIGSIASFLVISMPIFNGKYDNLKPSEISKMISENSFVCMFLIYQFSKLMDVAVIVSTLAGVTHRVAEFIEVLDVIPPVHASIVQTAIENLSKKDRKETSDDVLMAVEDLNLTIPDSSILLVKQLTMRVHRGKSLLIMGPSSSGKSSLLRVLRGIWPDPPDSKIHRGNCEKMFIPQRVFLSEGCNLRDQIKFPKRTTHPNAIEDQIILDILNTLGLQNVFSRCNNSLEIIPIFNWSSELSPGEIARLCFARIFFHKPQLTILDEATAPLPIDVEEVLYKKCLDLGMTLISVGHRKSLIKFHETILELGLPGGGWKLSDISSEHL